MRTFYQTMKQEKNGVVHQTAGIRLDYEGDLVIVLTDTDSAACVKMMLEPDVAVELGEELVKLGKEGMKIKKSKPKEEESSGAPSSLTSLLERLRKGEKGG